MINEEINKRIVGTALEMTLIKLVTRPDDSIFYCVGSDKFDDLEQITNKEARDLIKKTIKEWQASKN
jgi:predicted phosphoribosyltransferase